MLVVCRINSWFSVFVVFVLENWWRSHANITLHADNQSTLSLFLLYQFSFFFFFTSRDAKRKIKIMPASLKTFFLPCISKGSTKVNIIIPHFSYVEIGPCICEEAILKNAGMLIVVHLGALAQGKRFLQLSFIILTNFDLMNICLCHLDIPDSYKRSVASSGLFINCFFVMIKWKLNNCENTGYVFTCTCNVCNIGVYLCALSSCLAVVWAASVSNEKYVFSQRHKILGCLKVNIFIRSFPIL